MAPVVALGLAAAVGEVGWPEIAMGVVDIGAW